MSERLYRLGAVIRADVLIRLRRPSTAVVFVLLSFVPYLWIPPTSTGRTLIDIAGRRALYNSAAIGVGTAVLGTFFIGLAGFYVISNAVKRDVLSRCGFVIASTTLRGSEYIFGKFAGNVLFLSIFTAGYMATAMGMVLVRGEAPLEPLVFAAQYLLLVPPAIVAVSALAILFECTPILRSLFGDVLYFFVWLGLMGSVAMMTDNGIGGAAPAYFDVSGLAFLFQQFKVMYHSNSVSIGATSFDATKAPLVFPGLSYSWHWVAPRIASTLWPMLLLVIARVFFHRFDPARVRAMPNETSRTSWAGRFNALSKPIARVIVRIGNAAASLPGLPTLARAVVTDALATIAAFPLAALVMVVFALISIGASDTTLFTGIFPVAYAACAVTLAGIACREKRADTTALVYAATGLRAQFVLWKFASAVLVALAFLGVPIARGIALRPAAALPLLVSVLFVSAAATALGILSSNAKTFIVAFLTFWYVVVNDKGASPSLDFAGWFGKITPAMSLVYVVITFGFLILAQLFHQWDLRRNW
jgi:hypothetical protein